MSRTYDLITLRDAVQAGEYEPDMFCSMWHSSGLCVRAEGAFGGSVDDALALLAAVLPDEGWEVYRTSLRPGMIPGSSRFQYCAKVGWGSVFRGEAETPARALLIATLNAMIGEPMEGQSDG